MGSANPHPATEGPGRGRTAFDFAASPPHPGPHILLSRGAGQSQDCVVGRLVQDRGFLWTPWSPRHGPLPGRVPANLSGRRVRSPQHPRAQAPVHVHSLPGPDCRHRWCRHLGLGNSGCHYCSSRPGGYRPGTINNPMKKAGKTPMARTMTPASTMPTCMAGELCGAWTSCGRCWKYIVTTMRR